MTSGASRKAPTRRRSGCGTRGCRRETYVGRADRSSPTAVRDRHAGFDCWRVSYTTPKGGTVAYWVDPERGYNVLRIEGAFTSFAGKPIVDRVDCDLQKVEGLWFPRSCRYRRTEEGGKVTSQEDLEVEVVSLNEPIDPEVFSLQGIDIIPEDATVVWVSDREPPVEKPGIGSLKWDGEKLFWSDALPGSAAEEAGGNTLLLVLSVVFAGVAVAAVLWLRRGTAGAR